MIIIMIIMIMTSIINILANESTAIGHELNCTLHNML